MWYLIGFMLLSGVCFAADITIKNVPDDITEQKIKEWVSILIERNENAKLNNIPELKAAAESAKTTVDNFRTANDLEAKFAKPVEPVEKPAKSVKPMEESVSENS